MAGGSSSRRRGIAAAVNPRVRFEDEAYAEYRFAGRYYEDCREHLGIEFFDAVR